VGVHRATPGAATPDVGITRAEEQLDQSGDRLWDIGSAIKELPPSINQALAAAIVDAGRETTTGCAANDPTSRSSPFSGWPNFYALKLPAAFVRR